MQYSLSYLINDLQDRKTCKTCKTCITINSYFPFNKTKSPINP
jgi:hypothetical protein